MGPVTIRSDGTHSASVAEHVKIERMNRTPSLASVEEDFEVRQPAMHAAVMTCAHSVVQRAQRVTYLLVICFPVRFGF